MLLLWYTGSRHLGWCASHYNSGTGSTGAAGLPLRVRHNIQLPNRDVAVQDGRLAAGQMRQRIGFDENGVRPGNTGCQLGNLPGTARGYDGRRRRCHLGWDGYVGCAGDWADLGFADPYEVLHGRGLAGVHVDDDGLELLLLRDGSGGRALLDDGVVEDFEFLIGQNVGKVLWDDSWGGHGGCDTFVQGVGDDHFGVLDSGWSDGGGFVEGHGGQDVGWDLFHVALVDYDDLVWFEGGLKGDNAIQGWFRFYDGMIGYSWTDSDDVGRRFRAGVERFLRRTLRNVPIVIGEYNWHIEDTRVR